MMQLFFSVLVFVDFMWFDGILNILVMGGEVMFVELVYEIMGLQVCFVFFFCYYFVNVLVSIIVNWFECNYLEVMYLLVIIFIWFGLGFFKFLSFFWY